MPEDRLEHFATRHGFADAADLQDTLCRLGYWRVPDDYPPDRRFVALRQMASLALTDCPKMDVANHPERVAEALKCLTI